MTAYTASSGNPYTTMVNAYVRQLFYGRQAELQLLAHSLNGPTPKSYALVGSPKIGKTALILHYCEQARLDPQRLVIYIDCYQRTADELLERFAADLLAQIEQRGLLADECEELRLSLSKINPLDVLRNEQREALGAALLRTLRILGRAGQYPLVCLDHFVLDPAALSEVLPFREWGANASFIFAVEPDWLEEVKIKAPFIDMLFIRRIGLLPLAEGAELMNGPLVEAGLMPWMDEEVRGIYWIAGGNPYVLAIVCEELYNQRMRGSSVLTPQLFSRDERLVKDLVSLPAISQYFSLLWRRLKPAAQALLYEAGRLPDTKPPALPQLDDRARGSVAVNELRNWALIDLDSESGNLVLCSALLQRFVRTQEAPATAKHDELGATLDEFERTLRGNNEGLLFQVLRANAGVVLSVDELRRRVWNDASERHVVDQTLSRLRKRLRDQLGMDDLIRSVRGQGYVFVLPSR
jgi:hypothetical protein